MRRKKLELRDVQVTITTKTNATNYFSIKGKNIGHRVLLYCLPHKEGREGGGGGGGW